MCTARRALVIVGSYLVASYVAGLVLTILMMTSQGFEPDMVPVPDEALPLAVRVVLFTPLLAGVAGMVVAVQAFVPWVLALTAAVWLGLKRARWAAATGVAAGAMPLALDFVRVGSWPDTPQRLASDGGFLAVCMVSGLCAGLTFWWLAKSSVWPRHRPDAPPAREAEAASGTGA